MGFIQLIPTMLSYSDCQNGDLDEVKMSNTNNDDKSLQKKEPTKEETQASTWIKWSNSIKDAIDNNCGGYFPERNKNQYLNALFLAFLAEVKRNPKIVRCTMSSILQSLNECAQYMLLPGASRQLCALVPYNSKERGLELTFQPMYKGLLKVAYECGIILSVDCEVVYDKDFFKYEQGLELTLKYSKNLVDKDRGAVRAAYVVIKLQNGGTIVEVMREDQIDVIRKKSKNKPIWDEHTDEQRRKTVLKRGLKRTQQADKLQALIELDNRTERDFEAEKEAKLAAKEVQELRLKAKLAGTKPTNLITGDDTGVTIDLSSERPLSELTTKTGSTDDEGENSQSSASSIDPAQES